jgi:hypothetical protein
MLNICTIGHGWQAPIPLQRGLNLKVLSSEMAPPGCFKENPAVPHPGESSLKIPRHLVQLLAIRILIANGAHSSVRGNFLIHAIVGHGALNL